MKLFYCLLGGCSIFIDMNSAIFIKSFKNKLSVKNLINLTSKFYILQHKLKFRKRLIALLFEAYHYSNFCEILLAQLKTKQTLKSTREPKGKPPKEQFLLLSLSKPIFFVIYFRFHDKQKLKIKQIRPMKKLLLHLLRNYRNCYFLFFYQLLHLKIV